MKIPTLNYIHKSIKKLSSSYRKFNLFGSGIGGSRNFLASNGTEQYFMVSAQEEPILEYENITIEEGVSVTAFSPSLNYHNIPFYLKVNGTLTVNGHLHMDNAGGVSTASYEGFTSYYIPTNTGYLFSFPVYVVPNALNYIEGSSLPIIEGYNNGPTSCSTHNYSILKTYGQSPTFFNGKVAVTGSGFPYPVNFGSDPRNSFIVQPTSPISASPRRSGPYVGDGGGGFLALYYENLKNSGKFWKDTVTSSPTYGQTFPLNIHCNGSDGNTSVLPPPSGGGGMMVIAARNIVVGPKGSITCDATHLGFGGEFALLNRAPQKGMIFSHGIPQESSWASGGGGVCLGYKR